MNDIKKNEGIIMSGGTINANSLAVGKGAKAVSTSLAPNDSAPHPGSEAFEEIPLLNVLRNTLIEYFSESELRDLCFQLGIDYENVSGPKKTDTVRELLLFLKRSERLDELISRGQRLRPHGHWNVPEDPIDPVN